MKKTVSERALIARINRQLRKEGKKLMKTPPSQRQSIGRFHIVDEAAGEVLPERIEFLDAFLKPGEELEQLKIPSIRGWRGTGEPFQDEMRATKHYYAAQALAKRMNGKSIDFSHLQAVSVLYKLDPEAMKELGTIREIVIKAGLMGTDRSPSAAGIAAMREAYRNPKPLDISKPFRSESGLTLSSMAPEQALQDALDTACETVVQIFSISAVENDKQQDSDSSLKSEKDFKYKIKEDIQIRSQQFIEKHWETIDQLADAIGYEENPSEVNSIVTHFIGY